VCITPCTRPNIRFDERGDCNCGREEVKRAIDWEARRAAFVELAERTRSASSGWDCVIPVSGGKDSTWQVVTCLEHGLRPLAVTWRAPARTEVGERNLQNLIDLGVDHIDFTVNPRVEKRFMYEAFIRYGSPAVPMHMALFAIPLTMAVRFSVPLVVWGENSAFEYGGSDELREGMELNEAWLRDFGGTFGTTAADWVGPELSEGDLTAYRAPDDATLGAAGVRAIFLGCYFPWDPQRTYEVAAANGFHAASAGPKTGLYDYADIDDHFISIHHWLKWYKFGFTRLFDNLSIEIRAGRITREQAIEMVRVRGDQTPHDDIRRFCEHVGITEEHFFEVAERFRNPEVWERRDDRWAVRDFLVPDWSWA
jgi:N-acetyl sugar amidotransferase